MDISVIISIISVALSAGALFITLVFNLVSHKQYMRSLEPQLTFRLIDYGGNLYLSICNTGKSAATGLQVTPTKMHDNGDKNELRLASVFHSTFELYPDETVQGLVGFSGENLATSIFPNLDISVHYKSYVTKKKHSYTRKVTYTQSYDKKVSAKVEMNLGTVDCSIKSLARSNIRIANYLDGNQLLSIDQINRLSNRSLQNDLCDVMTGKDKSQIIQREEIV